MNAIKRFSLLFVFLTSLTACVSLSDGKSIVKTEDGVLVSMTNMTLYTFDGDKANSGRSSCYNECASNWPALLVDKNASSYGNYSIITRDDGKKQFAYKGMPLYYFMGDKKPGDRLGNNAANGAWHVVKM